tara:strand:+ start:1475 stop:1897 length:423 start_codon:yes stop_codon:yes gene_type:complete
MMAYKKNKEAVAKYNKEYRKRPYVIERERERTESGYWNKIYWTNTQYREKHKWAKVKRIYGLDKEDFERMRDEQENKCKICGMEFMSGLIEMKERKYAPNIDHCHESGKVRGLLCGSCNTGLGLFKDSKENLQSAMEYLG